MTELLFLGLALLVIGGGWIARRRATDAKRRITDDVVRQIEATGRVEIDEIDPLDLDEVRAEEDAFWEQTWDEPEEL